MGLVFICFLVFLAVLAAWLPRLDPRGGQLALRAVNSGLELSMEPDSFVVGEGSRSAKPVPRGGRVKRYISPYAKKLVAARQQWRCKICSRLLDASFEIDHIVPLFRGGSNDSSNLQALCRSPCHMQKSALEASRQ
jgi:hypothetical protein